MQTEVGLQHYEQRSVSEESSAGISRNANSLKTWVAGRAGYVHNASAAEMSSCYYQFRESDISQNAPICKQISKAT